MFESTWPSLRTVRSATGALALLFLIALVTALWELVGASSYRSGPAVPWVLLLLLSLAGLTASVAVGLFLERHDRDRPDSEQRSRPTPVRDHPRRALHDLAGEAGASPAGSEIRGETVVASAGEGVITTDPDGRIVSINPAMEELVGWSEDDVRGRAYCDAYPAVDRRGRPIPEDHRLLPKALKLGQPLYSRGFNLSFLKPAGTPVSVGVVASPIVDGDGRVIGGVELVRDLSYEREVDEMKTTLVSTVSHEVRTPLTMIQGFSELLLTRDLGEEKSREALKQINSSAERLARLINDLLSVTRIESGRLVVKTAPVELPSVIDEVLAPFTERHPDRRFGCRLDDDLPPVRADRDKLVQVLTNLLSNAVKYSPGGSPVLLFASRRASIVEIAVKDHGIGLSDEEIAKAFDKFFRSERAELQGTSGSGLGLYIAKSFVEMQGGKLWVSSEVGRGSTFYVGLPAEAGDRVLLQMQG